MASRQLAVEDAAVALASRRPEVRQRGANAALMTEHLIEVAVEEDRMPCLIGDLRGEKYALVLTGCGVQNRRQSVGHDLLAEEEQGHRRPQRRLHRGRDVGPVALVLLEVEVRHRPLLRLPAPVERSAVVLRTEERVHLGLDVVHGHVHELVERGLLDSSDGLEGGSVGHSAMLGSGVACNHRFPALGAYGRQL